MARTIDAITLYHDWRAEGKPSMITGREAANLSIETIGVIADGLKRHQNSNSEPVSLATAAKRIAEHRH